MLWLTVVAFAQAPAEPLQPTVEAVRAWLAAGSEPWETCLRATSPSAPAEVEFVVTLLPADGSPWSNYTVDAPARSAVGDYHHGKCLAIRMEGARFRPVKEKTTLRWTEPVRPFPTAPSSP